MLVVVVGHVCCVVSGSWFVVVVGPGVVDVVVGVGIVEVVCHGKCGY